MKEGGSYDLAGTVIGLAMTVHRELGPGFQESVYQNALALEFSEHGLVSEQFIKLSVFYKGRLVGDFVADMAFGKELIIELKAVSIILTAHEVQLVNYLKATGINEGLLLNFGAESLQFKKKYLHRITSK
jgi:GxxExxY protein